LPPASFHDEMPPVQWPAVMPVLPVVLKPSEQRPPLPVIASPPEMAVPNAPETCSVRTRSP
jgi:hypothetical protein